MEGLIITNLVKTSRLLCSYAQDTPRLSKEEKQRMLDTSAILLGLSDEFLQKEKEHTTNLQGSIANNSNAPSSHKQGMVYSIKERKFIKKA